MFRKGILPTNCLELLQIGAFINDLKSCFLAFSMSVTPHSGAISGALARAGINRAGRGGGSVYRDRLASVHLSAVLITSVQAEWQ